MCVIYCFLCSYLYVELLYIVHFFDELDTLFFNQLLPVPGT